ncbi:MAG: PepSY-associated TM helix domain-containing protein, partial [Alphaproteobacteria bacterium]
IVMVVTGLYLWWPRAGRGVAGVLYPRLSASGRLFWRDLHAVTGVWLSFLAMFFLLSALPWTTVWGGGFKYLRSVGKQQLVKQDWPTGPADKEQKAKEGFENTPAAPAEDPHARHRGQAGAALAPARDAISGFDRIAPIAARLGLAAPVSIAPPSPEMPNWTVSSISQNRMLQKTVMFDAKTLEKVTESGFADRPFIDRVFGIAISAHEGQLFGWFNQLLGLLTAAGYLVLVVSSAVMWWRRRPRGALGAPPAFAPEPRLALSIVVMIAFLGVFLPTLGVSLVLVLTAEQIIRRFAPRTSRWLGLRPAG